MKNVGRYSTLGSDEGEFEKGSKDSVLRNLKGIKKKREMDIAEAIELKRTINESINSFSKTHRFSASDICKLHKIWLGNIYSWSGSYRHVNMSKDGFPFYSDSSFSRRKWQIRSVNYRYNGASS